MRSRNSSPNRTHGFTLVEILVALAIFGIVIAQAFAVFGAQHITYATTERAIEVQQDSRLIADAVLGDIRMAGYMVPRSVGIGSVDGGNAAPDEICISDPSVIEDSEVASALDRFAGATLSANLGASANTATLDDASLDVDGDGDDDFTVGRAILFADGNNSHCALIEAITPAGLDQTVQFTPPTPAGFAIASGAGAVAPAVIYQLAGGDLLRNGRRLANGVEDLQIEFGVDTNGDGQLTGAEFPVHDLDGADPTDVRSIRLSIITRGPVQEENLQTPGRQAAANRAASGTPDGFRRRRVTTTLVPRNLL